MKTLTALEIVEIRMIEDQICLCAMKCDFQGMAQGYKKINDIRK